MKMVLIVAVVMVISACNAHGLRSRLQSEPAPLANVGRVQFNCTAGGLFIFEDFPDLKAPETVGKASYGSAGKRASGQRNSAELPEDCLSDLI